MINCIDASYSRTVMNSIRQYFACDLIHSIIMDASETFTQVNFRGSNPEMPVFRLNKDPR